MDEVLGFLSPRGGSLLLRRRDDIARGRHPRRFGDHRSGGFRAETILEFVEPFVPPPFGDDPRDRRAIVQVRTAPERGRIIRPEPLRQAELRFYFRGHFEGPGQIHFAQLPRRPRRVLRFLPAQRFVDPHVALDEGIPDRPKVGRMDANRMADRSGGGDEAEAGALEHLPFDPLVLGIGAGNLHGLGDLGETTHRPGAVIGVDPELGDNRHDT
jgi:hypothetical protein